MITSLEWQLRLIAWDFFATLTWDEVELTTPSSRRKHVERWIERWAAHVCGLKSRHIAWVVRFERGELGGRPHCHLLISRIPSRFINLSMCFHMMNMWMHKHPCECTNGNTEVCGRGISRVRLYDPSAGGVPYMLKGKFGVEWTQGANNYELKKFNSDDCDALFISPRAWQEMVEARTTARRMSPVS